MNTLPAQEIKRRGISAVDELLEAGPVHVISNNRPKYVVLSEDRYRDLLDSEDEAQVARVRESLAEYAAGNVERGTAETLIQEIGLGE